MSIRYPIAFTEGPEKHVACRLRINVERCWMIPLIETAQCPLRRSRSSLDWAIFHPFTKPFLIETKSQLPPLPHSRLSRPWNQLWDLPRCPSWIERPIANSPENVWIDVAVEEKPIKERIYLRHLIRRKGAMIMRSVLRETLIVLSTQSLIDLVRSGHAFQITPIAEPKRLNVLCRVEAARCN